MSKIFKIPVLTKVPIRIDKFLAEQKKAFSRSQFQKLIKIGAVTLNKITVRNPHQIINIGDQIKIRFPAEKKIILHHRLPLPPILYEDKDLIVIDKTAGLIVHPRSKHDDKQSLVSILLSNNKQLSTIAGPLKPGILHRLDQDTSGIIVIAKNNHIHQLLQNQIQKHQWEKIYTALVCGHLKPEKAAIEAPIKRSRRNPLKMAISPAFKAKYALSIYEVKEYLPSSTLVEIKIVTGRTHQIRVHLKSIGFPVIGDDKYGNQRFNIGIKKQTGLDRQFLHASSLKFWHPIKKTELKITSSLPADLKKALTILRSTSSL